MTVISKSPLVLVALLGVVGCGASSNATSAPTGKEVAAPFIVTNINGARDRVDVAALSEAGPSCTESSRASAAETPDGIRVEVFVTVPLDPSTECTANTLIVTQTVALPRPLVPDEQVQGECRTGRLCDELRDTVANPIPSPAPTT
ncbi:MAG: hypothetical protein LH469_06560 [Frankiaceae bacterium]|nr:hypothetical protein [Frankiaceae bacterium]